MHSCGINIIFLNMSLPEESKLSSNCHVVFTQEADHMNDDIVTILYCSDVFGSTTVLQEINEINLNGRGSESESTGSDDQQANNWNDDVDGLDEGVGDISSWCEHRNY